MIAFLSNQLAAHFCCRQACVQTAGTKLWIGLTLPIHDGRNITEQVGEVLLTSLSASRGVRIETDDPLLQFVLAFADRSAIPSQLSFCQPLTPFSQCTYCTCHKQAARTAFEHFSRLSHGLRNEMPLSDGKTCGGDRIERDEEE
jgi:hypothetical protein